MGAYRVGSEMRCEQCASTMVLATRSREIETYRCPRGCNGSYRTMINAAPAADALAPITGIKIIPVAGDFAQTAGIQMMEGGGDVGC